VTTLTATATTNAATGLPGVRLDVAAAPAPPSTLYASDFSATVDSWSVIAGTATLTRYTPDTPDSLRLTATTDTATAGRTVTGLTVGASYRFKVAVNRMAGTVQLGVSGVAGGPVVTPSAKAADAEGFVYLSLDFTATATSHTLRVNIARSGGTWSSAPDYRFRDATLTGPTGTWQGTTIYRTDSLGTSVPVREPGGGTDTTSAGTMRVYDWEAPTTGETISYTVVDGTGGTATATATLTSASTWLQLPNTTDPRDTGFHSPPNSVALFKVTSWEAQRDSIGQSHQIIGRTDKVGNPGPLAQRVGTFDVLALTYDAVVALVALIGGGATVMMRQPTHKGLDLYFTVTDLRTRMDTDSQTWTAAVGFEEVPRP
jgi:hypothetical protein